MRNFKSLIAGLIIGIMLMTAVFASTQTIEAFFNNIKISLDGKAVELTDASGNPVDPFIYNGTTYLPVRAVADALGMEVKFNETTNTVELARAKEVKEVKQLDITKQWSIDDFKTTTENEYLKVQARPDGTKYIYQHTFNLYLNKIAAKDYLTKWNEKYPEASKHSNVITEIDEANLTMDFILEHYDGRKIVLLQDAPIVKWDIILLPYDEYMNNILPALIEAIKQNQ
jgi:hypothetical protein